MKYRARIGGFPEDEFVEVWENGLQMLPDPHRDEFSGGVFDEFVEGLMIDDVDDRAAHNRFDRFEILNHAGSRAVILQRAANCNFETI